MRHLIKSTIKLCRRKTIPLDLHFQIAHIRLTSNKGLSRLESDLRLSYRFSDSIVLGGQGEASLVYALTEERKELTVLADIPGVEGFEKFGFSVAHENSTYRKTAKAIIKYPSMVSWPFHMGSQYMFYSTAKSHRLQCLQGVESLGVEFDFKYKSIKDFLVLVNLEVPIEGLRLTKIQVENEMNDSRTRMVLGGRWRSVEGTAGVDLGLQSQQIYYDFTRSGTRNRGRFTENEN